MTLNAETLPAYAIFALLLIREIYEGMAKQRAKKSNGGKSPTVCPLIPHNGASFEAHTRETEGSLVALLAEAREQTRLLGQLAQDQAVIKDRVPRGCDRG